MKHSQFQIINADCREAMAAMDADSVDSIVCDPPYGLSFMGKGWDHGVPGVEFWQAALRVVKPGGHLLAFGGTRTFHRLMVAIEDAGWELRDTIGWIYGSGFPKSLNVSKAVERLEVAASQRLEVSAIERQFCEWVANESGLSAADFGTDRFHACRVEFVNTATAEKPRWGRRSLVPTYAAWLQIKRRVRADIPAWVEAAVKNPPAPPMEHPGQWKKGAGEGTAGSNEWAGWGTALKPAWEPIVVARKPLIGTVAENVLRHGTGGMNIDGCRVAGNIDEMRGRSGTSATPGGDTTSYRAHNANGGVWDPSDLGRWPANIITDGSEEVIAMFPSEAGAAARASGPKLTGTNTSVARGRFNGLDRPATFHADTGSAARFFYCAKASKADRNEGLPAGMVNNHPTVKPTDLMRYLCRLVTPPGGLVLDPFCGSGSTGKAAVLEGFRFVGVEQDSAYVAVAIGRIETAVETSGDKVAG